VLFTNSWIVDIIKQTDLERIKQMTTKREYLKAQGIAVGVRGRFSGAAKVALQEAASKGITFTVEVPVKKAK
jgi:hypothetical protein